MFLQIYVEEERGVFLLVLILLQVLLLFLAHLMEMETMVMETTEKLLVLPFHRVVPFQEVVQSLLVLVQAWQVVVP